MPERQYAAPLAYEKKLERVIERLGANGYDFNYDRHGAWVQFRYKGELYRFDHSVEKARAHGSNLNFGSDCFAQIVLSLEDLSRMVERGIYDLQTWVTGMKFLPPAVETPTFFRQLGFVEMPGDMAEVKARFRGLAKQMHPDVGGDEEDFKVLKDAMEKAQAYFDSVGRG